MPKEGQKESKDGHFKSMEASSTPIRMISGNNFLLFSYFPPKLIQCLRLPIIISMESKEHWIFYLKLQKDLPKEYLVLDNHFKSRNKSLIPISIKGLLDCAKTYKSIHLLIVIKSYKELRYFDVKVKKLLKYLMRTDKINIYVTSSFSVVNDSTVMKRDKYNFIKLPVSVDYFCGSVSRMIDIKEARLHEWPGGAVPKLKLAG